jgi:hypothetical protein
MKNRASVVIGAIGLAFVAARLWGLTGQCLWFDEIFSVHAAETSLPALFDLLAKDLIHPPFFYLLLKAWIAIGGDGILWLRLFPVVIAVIGIIPFISLCRELRLTAGIQAIGLFLLAVNGTLIKYAQEVRMYSLLMTLSLFSFWLFVRLVNSGKGIVALTLVNILLVHTHYFGWFVVVAESVLLVWHRPEKLVAAKATLGITAIAFMPWIIVVANAAAGGASIGQNLGWMTRPGVAELLGFAFDVVEPFYHQLSSSEPSTLYYTSVPMLLIFAVAKLNFLAGEKDVESRRAFHMLAFPAALPIAGAFAASWLLPYSIWGSRHLIIVYAPLLLSAAIFLERIASKKMKAFAIGAVLLLTALAFSVQLMRPQAEYAWCALSRVSQDARDLNARHLYVFEDLLAYQLWFENRMPASDQIKVVKVSGIEGIYEDKAYFLPRGFDGVETIDAAGLSASGLWLVYRANSFTEKEPPLRNFRNLGYEAVEKREYKVTSETVFLVRVER